MPFLGPSSIDSDVDSDVEILPESWETKLQKTKLYKTALSIFSSKKFNSPKLDVKRQLLLKFRGHQATDFFRQESEYKTAFEAIEKAIRESSHGKTVSYRNKTWTQPFCANHLAMLISIRTFEKKLQEESKVSSLCRGMTPLKRVFIALEKIYNPSLKLFEIEQVRQSNVKHRTPTLNYQNSGKRIQDTLPFSAKDVDKNACPVCLHSFTMTVGNAEANTKNQELRTATAGEKFDAVSAVHACYCYSIDCHGDPNGIGCPFCEALAKKGTLQSDDVQPGYCGFLECKICAHSCNDSGCSCQVSFNEEKRQMIATSIMKTKQKKSSGKPAENPAFSTTPGTASSALFKALSNRYVPNYFDLKLLY